MNHFILRPIFVQNDNMLDVLLNQPDVKPGQPGILKVSDRADKPIKSIMKSISWRVVGTIDTMVISYFITGKVTIALSIGSVEVFTKTILYYFHERLWAHIHKIKLKLWIRSNGKQYDKQYEVKGVERSAVR
jgi:uncharacterized membrane protein